MINFNTTLLHDFFQIAIRNSITDIEEYSVQDDTFGILVAFKVNHENLKLNGTVAKFFIDAKWRKLFYTNKTLRQSRFTAQLLEYHHLLPDSSFGINQLVKRVAKKEKAKVNLKIISNKLQFLRSFAQLNNSVVFMPVQAVYTDVQEGILMPVNLNCNAFTHRNLSIATRRQRSLSAATIAFSQFGLEQFATWQDLDQAALETAQSHWQNAYV